MTAHSARPGKPQMPINYQRRCIELESKVKQLEEQIACLNFFADGPDPDKIDALRKHNAKLLRALAARIGVSLLGSQDLRFLADRIEKGRDHL